MVGVVAEEVGMERGGWGGREGGREGGRDDVAKCITWREGGGTQKIKCNNQYSDIGNLMLVCIQSNSQFDLYAG